MAMKRRELIRLITAPEHIEPACDWVRAMVTRGLAAGPVQVSIGRERRSKDLNSKMWPMLTDLHEQVDWYGKKPTPEEWKHIITASIQRQTVYPGIDGGFVVCGLSTSSMTKRQFRDVIEAIYAFGAEHGVEWSEPPKSAEELWREAA